MRFSRRLLRSDFVLNIGAALIAAYIRLIHATARWQIEGIENRDALIRQGGAFIFAFWHGRLLMMPRMWPGHRPFRMLISRHRDGEIIARTVGRFGITTVRGSTAREGRSDKGGSAALLELVRAVRHGDCIGITPDGPRGPRMRVADGVMALARVTGVPVVPVTYACSNALALKSWDRFQLPLPFGRIAFVWGTPFMVGRDTEGQALDDRRDELERIMNSQLALADQMVGRVAVEPAGATDARA